jgi:hypothetical protein
VRQRKQAEYFIYANKGDEVTLRVQYLPVGNYSGSEMEIPVLSESGKRVATLLAPFKEDTQCSFVAPKTGTYKLVCDAQGNCVHMDSPTHRLCITGTNKAIPLIRTSGDFFFWVPGDVKEFGVKVFGSGDERVNATIFDPSGKPVWSEESISITQMFDSKPRTAGEDEIWRLRVGRPTKGAFEDFFIDLRGIPCVLAREPEMLLKPAETESD